jgi:hypothetical protein
MRTVHLALEYDAQDVDAEVITYADAVYVGIIRYVRDQDQLPARSVASKKPLAELQRMLSPLLYPQNSAGTKKNLPKGRG